MSTLLGMQQALPFVDTVLSSHTITFASLEHRSIRSSPLRGFVFAIAIEGTFALAMYLLVHTLRTY